MKKWKCTVCGYIHTGDEPPDTCPVCGADKSKFVEVADEADPPPPEPVAKETDRKATEADPASPASPSGMGTAQNLIVKHHLHPITVHVPNGVVPVSVLFLSLAVVFGFLDATLLSKAAYLNLIVVFLSLPVVIFTGWCEWRLKYNGALTSYFIIKITCAAAATILVLIILSWLIMSPEVVILGPKWLFLLINFILLGVVGVAGHIGGKLVFKE